LFLASFVALGVVVGISGVFGVFAALAEAQKHGGHIDPHATIRAVIILYAALIVMAVSIGPTFHALITNLIWNNTRIGEHRIECNISAWKLIWITLSNLVLVVLTIGLFIPWAQVRLTKYQLESVRLLPATDLQEFEEAEPETVGAVGEEAATAFDFDIAL
jgi:uncharacterized membrane protein YjgN (DUF898 family)